ncbi:hypothetical protein J2T17_007458 [Paenibacillus mucilaginosus]|uniref:pPIWI-associating nuclease domain-containing protein n=1 Tax=Paenibacillus mucilaginosus TaxID=61624 RepID=UPI003D19D124
MEKMDDVANQLLKASEVEPFVVRTLTGRQLHLDSLLRAIYLEPYEEALKEGKSPREAFLKMAEAMIVDNLEEVAIEDIEDEAWVEFGKHIISLDPVFSQYIDGPDEEFFDRLHKGMADYFENARRTVQSLSQVIDRTAGLNLPRSVVSQFGKAMNEVTCLQDRIKDMGISSEVMKLTDGLMLPGFTDGVKSNRFSELRNQIISITEAARISEAQWQPISEALLGNEAQWKMISDTVSAAADFSSLAERVNFTLGIRAEEMSAAGIKMLDYWDRWEKMMSPLQELLRSSPWIDATSLIQSRVTRPWAPIIEETNFVPFTESYIDLTKDIDPSDPDLMKLVRVSHEEYSNDLRLVEQIGIDHGAEGESQTSLTAMKERSELLIEVPDVVRIAVPHLENMWLGACHALQSSNPDKIRHVTVSLRELLTQIIHTLAPDDEIRKWTEDPTFYHENKPTRAARFKYMYRDVTHGPMGKFLEQDIKQAVEWIQFLNKHTHGNSLNLSDTDLYLLLTRTHGMLSTLSIVVR